MRNLWIALVLALATPASAENAPPAAGQASVYQGLTQIALTDAQVRQYIAAIPDMQTAMAGAPDDAGQPDPKVMAQLETIAKKYSFKDFDEFNSVAGNIAVALDGVDPKTKTYVGAEERVKQAIAETKADPKLSPAEKKVSLEGLDQELQNVTPVKFKGNIELVVKNYDALNGSEGAAK